MKAHFVLVGDADPDNPASLSREQLAEWERSGTVAWWGQRNDMERVLAQASLVCLPSYREGLPKVLLEAGAVGRAVVTTDVPGCRDVVRHGDTGLLVPARDPRALADAIRDLLVDPARRRAMGEQARERVETQFSEAVILPRMFAVYGRATGDANGPKNLV